MFLAESFGTARSIPPGIASKPGCYLDATGERGRIFYLHVHPGWRAEARRIRGIMFTGGTNPRVRVGSPIFNVGRTPLGRGSNRSRRRAAASDALLRIPGIGFERCSQLLSFNER